MRWDFIFLRIVECKDENNARLIRIELELNILERVQI